jgi:hypothetical protein
MRKLAAVLLLALAGCLGPDHIEMEPNQLTFSRRGDQVWEHAVFMDTRGKSYPRQAATWSSSNEKVAKVDNVEKPGNVTAVGPGHAVISVKGAGGLVAEVRVDVETVEKLKVAPNPVKLVLDGDRVALQVEPLDVDGHVLRERKPHLKCANEKVCNCDASGVWPVGEGQTTVEVAVDDQTVTLPVVVEKGKKK